MGAGGTQGQRRGVACTGPWLIRLMVLVLGARLGPAASGTQETSRLPRIGYLAADLAPAGHFKEAFRQGLRDLGSVEGRHVLIEYWSAEGKLEQRPALAAELVALRVDAIVAESTPPRAGRHAGAADHPHRGWRGRRRGGLVVSLARPGDSVTGSPFLGPELIGKGFDLLKQTASGGARVAILWHPGALGECTQREMLKEAEVAARALVLRR